MVGQPNAGRVPDVWHRKYDNDQNSHDTPDDKRSGGRRKGDTAHEGRHGDPQVGGNRRVFVDTRCGFLRGGFVAVLGGGGSFGFAFLVSPGNGCRFHFFGQDQGRNDQGDGSQRRIDPVHTGDADGLADGTEKTGQPATQIHQGIEHGVAHGRGGSGGELAHTGIGRRLIQAIAQNHDHHPGHGHDVHGRPKPRCGEENRSRRNDHPAHQQQDKSAQQSAANTLLVRHATEEEHADRDASGQHQHHVVGLDVSIGDALKNVIREVHGQVAQHAEIDPTFQEIGQIDAPQGPWRMGQIDKWLDDFLQGTLLFIRRRGLGHD